MPPRKERLSHQDFSSLIKRQTLRGELFDIAYFQSDSSRVGCVISKKRVKKAVDRNRIRRKMYHAFREVSLPRSYCVILYPQARVQTTPHVLLVKELQELLTKLH